MIDDKRLKKKDFVHWDFEVETNDPRSLDLLPTIAKVMDVPLQTVSVKEQTKGKDNCEECKYRQAIAEILNILEVCKLVKKAEETEGQKSEHKAEGYNIKVE